MVIEHLLKARYCMKCFTCIISSVLKTILSGTCCYDPHFTNEEKTQQDDAAEAEFKLQTTSLEKEAWKKSCV